MLFSTLSVTTFSFLTIGVTLLICPWVISFLARSIAAATHDGGLPSTQRLLFLTMWVISAAAFISFKRVTEGHFSTLLMSLYIVLGSLSLVCSLLLLCIVIEKPQSSRVRQH